ncbi:glycosyltransferase family 2 protein [Pseudomonadota bacterium]
MTINSVIRTVILKTNSYWPFHQLNRLPYRLAIWSFTRTCRGYAEIRSVYLRHALVDGQWTPALSDIDLSIIIDKALTPEHMYSFLQHLWKRLDRLQSWFPMIGEIEILSENHLDSWRKFRIEGREMVNWQLLAGKELVISEYHPSPTRFEREAFDYTFWFYVQNVTDLYRQEDSTSYLRRQDLMRLQRKMDRCLAAMGCQGSGTIPDSGREQSEAAVIVNLVADLERGLAKLRLPTGLGPAAIWRMPGIQKPESNEELPKFDLELEKFSGEVESVYLDHRGDAWVVLRDDAETVAKTQCVEAVRALFRKRDVNTLFFSPRLFAYMLRYLRPYDYAWWVEQARHVFGSTLLTGIAPPPMSAFRFDLLGHAPLLLMLPQCRDVVMSVGAGNPPPGGLEWNLHRAIALKHLLLGGKVSRSLDEMLTDCIQTDPDTIAVMRQLEDKLSGRLTGNVLFDWFVVMRNLLDDVHLALSSNEDWEAIKWDDQISSELQNPGDRAKTNDTIVSAIVPVHNGERFLHDAIDSILHQECRGIEIIIIDDGSTDDSARIAKSYGDKVRYVHQQNGGPATARNSGLGLAQGKYIAFLDADDLWPPGKLQDALEVLESDPLVDAVIGRSRFLKLASENSPISVYEEVLEPRVFLQMGSAVIRRPVFEKTGLFDTVLEYSEDIDWFLRAREQGMVLKTMNNISLLHRLHGGNMTSAVGRGQLQLARVLKRSLDRRREKSKS